MTQDMLAFGPFRLDPARRTLTRDGVQTELGQKACALLLALLQGQGQTLAKEALLDQVWPDATVEDGNLTVQIAGLRKLMGQDAAGRDWIVTVPRVGYRLVLPQPEAAPADLPRTLGLAVLPFQNLSGEAETDYFADGIVADLIIALSRFRQLAVASRSSSFTLKGSNVDARAAAQALGVGFLLEGSVRRAGARLRITAQLVDGGTGLILWTERFDGDLSDVFAFQDQITEQVATLVAPTIEGAELAQARRRWSASVSSYDLFLQARELINDETEAGNAGAHALLLRALHDEPDNPQFLAHASWALEHRHTMNWAPFGPDDVARCVDYARRGIRLAAGDARVLAHCGVSLVLTGQDHAAGLPVLAAAVAANPNDVFILGSAGIINVLHGDLDFAQQVLHRAIRLAPNDPATRFALIGLAQVELVQGRHDMALEFASRALALNDRFDPSYWMLIAACGHLGKQQAALGWIRQLESITAGVTIDRIRRTQKVAQPQRNQAFLEGLRLAGMPES
jgi:TolB-like protein/DNA-binding winged helix-turn-helix (wHTH) protein